MKIEHERFLVCFGCQRGGTTWLDDQLRRHPEFNFLPRKEIRYLDPIYVHDFKQIQKQRITEFRQRINNLGENAFPIGTQQARNLLWHSRYSFVSREDYSDAWYVGLYDGCDSKKVAGDFSPDYSLLPDEGVAHLARLVPQAKLLFIMRDPVDRTISGSTYVLRHRKQVADDEAQALVKGIALTKLQEDFSNYQTILARYEKYFPKESILVLFHDDIKKNPMGFLKSVCDHVGAPFDEKFFAGALEKDINRSPSMKVSEDTWREVSRRYLPLLEWLSEKYGSHATAWLEKAKARIEQA
jgi:hypothetical protein